jgi:tetrahydromethanopterin S-methyltransferase subunit C
MNWMFEKLPRPMQRTFRDDLKWATGYLVGLVAGYFVFGRGHIGLLIGGLVGVTVTIAGWNVARRVSRHLRR